MQTLVLLYALQHEASPPPGVATHGEQVWLLISLFINIIVQLYREARQRRWQQQDTARQKADLAEHEKTLQTSLAQQTEELKQSMRTRVTDLTKRFDSLLTEDERRRLEDG